jgi:HEAT repeat protein
MKVAKIESNSLVRNLLKSRQLRQWHDPRVIEFLTTGDELQFAQVPPLKDPYKQSYAWWQILPDPRNWTDEASRLIRIVVSQSLDYVVEGYLTELAHVKTDVETHGAAVSLLKGMNVPDDWIVNWFAANRLTDYETNEPTWQGLVVSQYDEARLNLVREDNRREIAILLAKCDPVRFLKLHSAGWWKDDRALDWRRIAFASPQYHELVRRQYDISRARGIAMLKMGGSYWIPDFPDAGIAASLAVLRPELYHAWAISEIEEIERTTKLESVRIGAIRCLCELDAPSGLAIAERWLADPVVEYSEFQHGHDRTLFLEFLERIRPDWIVSAAKAMTQCSLKPTVLIGLKAWRLAGLNGTRQEYQQILGDMLSVGEPKSICASINESLQYDLSTMASEIWPLMQHKSRPVRTAAARALAGLGFAEASPNGIKLLQSKKADVRLSAVTLFQRLGGPESMQVLKDRLETEEADAVRDAILLTLDAAGSLSLSAPDFAAGVQRTLAKAKGCPVAWLDPAKLNLARKDGSNLSADEVLYLLIRQSRCNEMRADIEARPLYATLDRKACATAALEVLEAFLASKQESGDRWTIAFAALTGDDRLVPPLYRAVIHWTDNARGKLAEYAVGALALIGTDAALMLLDSLSVRFRSKNKNIGEAAAEAFMAAAESRGVTVEELGDMVVPWLGFEPGVKKILTVAANSWEVWIGSDFKLVYKDTRTGKKLGKLPASVGTAIAEEQKTLSANLKEAVKAQLLRMETLLVRQFHWPVARWRELYLQHPLLRPFSEQLIWRYHPTDSKPLNFRSLGDGGLTNAEGNAFELPNEGTISLLHPLDLAEAEKEAWLAHLEDYEMLPPFPQLLRPVHSCRTEDRTGKMIGTVSGTELNAMTFRGRSEKLGWVRSSVCDAGGVGAYRKVFSGTGVDAFLQLEGMYVGITMHDSITLGDVYFVTSGSVKVGSYTYDEPSDGNDPRVIALGQGPPVAYSEVMADLYKISGKTVEEP